MKSTANGLKWSAIERLSTHAIQLVVMLYLARLLGPDVFGLMGILAVFIAIGQTLVNSGFSSALIRETKRTESDFSTTFYFNIGVGVVCYSILFFIAPYIAIFFEQPLLTHLLRVLGITVILNSLAIVQQAKLTIMMDFKTQAKASLISVLISSCFAILLANLNYGVWVLVWQALIYSACNSLILIFLCKWLPTTGFSKQSFNYLFGFGSKLLAAALLNTIFVNIYQVIIGKQFNSSQVGLFTQANQLANVPAITLTTVIQRVTYPMLSNIQNDTNKFESTYLLTLRFAGAVVFPLMIGLSLIATPLITVALGEKWLASAPLLSILCFAFILYPIHAINLNLLNVKGRSDIFLKLEIIKKSLIVLMLFITIPLGIKAMCIGMVGNSFIAFFINSFYTGKFSQLNTKKQLKALLPLFIGAFLCAVITYGITLFLSNIMMLVAYIQLFMSLTFMPLLYGMFIRFLQPDLYLQFKMALYSKNKIRSN